MTREMKENLALAIQEKQHVVSNKLNYTSIKPTYVTVQETTYIFSLSDVMSNNWWYGLYWKKNRCGVHLRNDVETQKSIREKIAEKAHLPIDEIDPILHINARGNGSPDHNVKDKHYAWGSYTVGFKHRKLEERTIFDQEKYGAALDLCDQNIASIKESIEVAGNVAEVDSI